MSQKHTAEIARRWVSFDACTQDHLFYVLLSIHAPALKYALCLNARPNTENEFSLLSFKLRTEDNNSSWGLTYDTFPM